MKYVNGGVIEVINGMEVEILSHHFHNPYYDIVCYYFIDNKRNKVEITYYKHLDSGEDGHEVYMFGGANKSQHYRSYNYRIDELPEKYREIAEELRLIHEQIDFNDFLERPN